MMKFLKKELGKVININNDKDKSYPIVLFENVNIARVLMRFVQHKRKINDVYGKVFLELGFDENDVIELKNIKYLNNDEISFNYVINGKEEENNIIILSFAPLIYQNKMLIQDSDMKVSLRIDVFNSNNIYMRIFRLEEKLNENIFYTRTYSYDKAEYKLRINDKELVFTLSKRNKIITGEYTFIDEELEIENYLKSINHFSIEDIYNGLVNIVGKTEDYLEFCLEVKDLSRCDDNITDKILFYDGVLEKFVITRGNKKVIIDSDGNASYKCLNENISVVTNVEDGKVSFCVSAVNDNDLAQHIFNYGFDEVEKAREEINDTKKMVKKLIKDSK